MEQRIRAAAMYCSDGRVGVHFDDFLTNGLGLPRYDRVALPGGPACLANHIQQYVSAEGTMQELRFLMEAHLVERLVLIAHEGCAFYGSRLHLEGEAMERQQKHDLAKAGRLIYRSTGLERIEGYYSRIVDGQIVFEAVPFDPLIIH